MATGDRFGLLLLLLGGDFNVICAGCCLRLLAAAYADGGAFAAYDGAAAYPVDAAADAVGA